MHQLQHELQKGPKQLFEIAQKIMKDVLNPEESLVALVDLASQAKADDFSLPLLPARYHVFIRAIEGAYLSLSRHKKLFLERRETNLVDGRKYTVFEIATCRWCGSVYLVGQREEGESGISYLKQPNHELQKVEYFLLAESEIQINEGDEDDEVSFPDIGMSLNKEDSYILCGSCGAIEKEGFLGKLCKCEENNLYRLLKVPSNEEDKVCSCPKCGRRSPKGIVWRFLVGNDAAASVLCTALYQQIKPKKQDLSQVIFHQEEEYDPWNPIEQVSSSATHHIQTEAPRKLLVFSDSRQDAAFFAPYLNRTYNQIMYRSIIVKALLEYRDEIVKNQWRLQDLVDPVYEIAKETEVLEGKSIQERKSEVWRWILHEFLTLDKWVNLEGLGLLHFSLVQPDHWVAPKPLMDPPWNMTKEEVWTLFQVLLDTIRSKGAVVFPKWISPKDEFFQPRNREFYIRAYQSNGKKGILCWNSERLNGRIDYLIRLAGRLNPELTEEDCRSLLRDLWDRCLFRKPGGGLWKGYFHPTNLPGEGVVYQMGYDVWEILSPLVQKDSKWYRCNKCHVITPYNIRGSCISYRCDGELQQCSPEEVFQNNHYYRLYMTTMPYRMQAQEHTAQLTSQAAAELQNMFIEGAVNILSCSTTFELGVDVGELETVFMRNMPPSAANYIQRAGRAGRRADSTAFVLTFAQRRSHDLTHFHEPWRMVSGEIRAPYFSLDNMKIILRHVFATALSAFWSHNEKYFGTVEDFFFGEEGTGSKRLRDFLSEKPLDLQESIRRIVPRHLHDKIGIQNWDWLKYLKGEDGVLYKTEKELEYDVKQIEEVREQLYKQKRDTDHLLRLLNTIKGRDILSFMSSHNIIPKYGFPVDVVELQLYHHHEEAKRLQLERDLRIALSEYAPGSQVVASGNLWTSRYIKRPPTKAWDRYRYVICTNCKSYHRIRAELLSEENSNPFSVCPLCKSKLTTHQGDFIVPSFGFIASIDQPGKPGEQRPEKTYTTRVYYSGQAVEDTSIRLALNGVVIHATSASHGRLAVINNGKGKGFKVCYQCGFAALDDEKVQYPHPNYWGGKCWEKLSKRLSLGHEFETDILKLYFEGFSDSREGFWLSMLYALLEGASEALDIERNDLNGCLYPMEGDPSRPTIILFDDVPGGAGHVRRIAQRNILKEVLRATYYKLSRCDCGGEDGNASCYGCLRNYYNQFCHGQLNRGMVMDFLKKIMAEDLTDHRGIAGIA